MGIYLGCVRNIPAGLYFKPLAELENSALKILTNVDRKKLLPASNEGIIWLYFSDRNAPEYFFTDKSLIIFEFESRDLEPEFTYNVKQTGYKVDYKKSIRLRRARRIKTENIFYADKVDDTSRGKIYALVDGDFSAKVFIPNEEDDSVTKTEYEAKIKEQQREITRLTDELKTVKTALENTGKELNDRTAALDAERRRQNAASDASAKILDAHTEISRLQKEIERLTEEVSNANEELGQYKKIKDLNGEIYHLKRTIEQLNNDCAKSNRDKQDAETQLNNLFRDTNKRMADIAFDGVMANKMLDAAANFDAKNLDEEDRARAEKIAAVKPATKSPEDLKDYLYYMIGLARPSYSEETILNIAISLTQNFLTVFYGEPGCGKTSICNLFAEALGLNKIAGAVNDARAGRYVPISVEKGWTSKRDFVGYYNPLSKTFDKSNRRIYDALRLLHAENKNSSLPFVVLLDEANLSPMEYYWSDFMNLCDELDENSSVNLGAEYIFTVPETLRFVATINNDHTTEELSPRLIDRACIITLPDFDAKNLPTSAKIPAADVEIISWQSLRAAFNPPNLDTKNFPANAYGVLVDKMKAAGFSVSPRVHKAVQKYYVVAEKFLGKVSAFDYAVAQKILPKIQGSDENFKAWLLDLQKTCTGYKLVRSEKILQKIIERGDKNMGYYRFFA